MRRVPERVFRLKFGEPTAARRRETAIAIIWIGNFGGQSKLALRCQSPLLLGGLLRRPRLVLVDAARRQQSGVWGRLKYLRLLIAMSVPFAAPQLSCAQTQAQYSGVDVTGQLVRTVDINLIQQAQLSFASKQPTGQLAFTAKGTPIRREPQRSTLSGRLRPSYLNLSAVLSERMDVSSPNLLVNTASGGFGFSGLTHLDQRNANGGNQFSVEPATPAIAVGEGFILEGVNNAVQIYNLAGIPQLPVAVSSNQLFGLPPAIDRITGVEGPYPTDMRVLYDSYMRRWFVMQWAQLNDADGNPLDQSREWIAVSQSPDPMGVYTIYAMDTTNALHTGCPCIPDYPLLGEDQFGIYLSSNEFSTKFNHFIDATILAISKSSLTSGADFPKAVSFTIPPVTGYEFAIHPATTPPNVSYFMTTSGTEYFASSLSTSSVSSGLAIWGMSNTSSLSSSAPALSLIFTIVPTLTYSFPDVATQRPGSLPYGSSLNPPGVLEFLDGGDTRILSLSYAAGSLYASMATEVRDETGRRLVGGAYFVLAPLVRRGSLSASVTRQGYLMVSGNHLLRSALAVDSQGRGVISFTLTGPDYYPSAAYVPIDKFQTGTTVQIAASGTSPEDGFTGYPNAGTQQAGVSRWGDNSGAVAGTDGSLWTVSEYIPTAPRTQFANWGTFIEQYKP